MSTALFEPNFALFVDLALKGAVILSVAFVLALVLRKASAAIRHGVWATALVGLLMLPVLTHVVPAWHLAVLPADVTFNAPVSITPALPVPESPPAPPVPPAPLEAPPAPPSAAGFAEAAPAPLSAQTEPLVAELTPAEGPAETSLGLMDRAREAGAAFWAGIKGWYGGLNPLEAIGLTWLLGVVFFAGRLFYGTWQMRRITRRASRVDEAQLIRLGSNIEMHYDIERPVRIYVSERVSMPMTWGAIRPVVLLPQDALEWDDERLRAVLLHEYAHIKRWDWVTQSVGQLAVALHWFNPLAWMALKQLRREHERASDDQVLMAGLKASSYATHLLDIARTYWTAGWVARPTVAMARRSELEGRMLAILDPRRRRNVTRVALGAGLLVALGVLVPLSALELEPATAAEVEAMPLSSLMIEEVPPPPAPAMTESVSPEVNPEAWEAYGDKVCRTVDQLYAFDRNGEFNLSNINGNATFRPSKDAEAHVKAEVCAYAKERLSEVEVVIDASKDRIKVEVDYDDWNNDGRWSREDRYLRQPASVEFVVEVPASAELDVSLINGNLDAEGFTGKLELATINGRLTAERFSGPADLSAINGRLTADLSKVEAEKVSLSNVNGPIEATLADKPDVRLQASTVHGKIRSDFAIKVQTNKYSSSKSASASMGNGRTRLTMSNVNGPVSIRSASGRSYGGEMTVEPGARAEYSDRKMEEQLRALESRMRAHQQLMTKHNRARGLERTELERQMRSLSAQQESMLRELWKQ
ncbi:MAG: M56 family metallopeptidase, partial [Bacteroidota bacterium]